METVEVGGLRIAYERAGAGRPIVLVHGYVGDGATTWGAQLDGLSDEFTMVAWDGPGAGASDDPPETFRMRDFADVLAGFIAELGLSRPHVAGLSFGGPVAIELYRMHPGMPSSVTLASAYAGWAGSLPREEVERRLGQVLELADLPAERFASEVAPTMFSRSAPEHLLERFSAAVAAFHPAGLRVMARAVAASDLRDVLPTIAVPSLLIYGDQDVRAPLTVARQIHDAIPRSKLVVISGAGHICSAEAPERFNAELRTFVRAAEG